MTKSTETDLSPGARCTGREGLNKLIQIRSPYFTAGIEIEDRKVVRAAPIVGYMVGWDERKAADYCRDKQWMTISVTGTLSF